MRDDRLNVVIFLLIVIAIECYRGPSISVEGLAEFMIVAISVGLAILAIMFIVGIYDAILDTVSGCRRWWQRERECREAGHKRPEAELSSLRYLVRYWSTRLRAHQ
jgi:hypothetical protein